MPPPGRTCGTAGAGDGGGGAQRRAGAQRLPVPAQSKGGHWGYISPKVPVFFRDMRPFPPFVCAARVGHHLPCIPPIVTRAHHRCVLCVLGQSGRGSHGRDTAQCPWGVSREGQRRQGVAPPGGAPQAHTQQCPALPGAAPPPPVVLPHSLVRGQGAGEGLCVGLEQGQGHYIKEAHLRLCDLRTRSGSWV